jgi:hypothetical protein
VTRDPLAPIPTTARLSAAAMLCALSLGLDWSVTTVSAAPVRLFVVAPALGLLVAALRPRTRATQRLARVATVALTVALAYALGHSNRQVVLLLAVAVVLAARPAWRSRVPGR